MASKSTGKWVERAATTGGGRTYRGQMPVNWYASLALICIVGLLLVRIQPVSTDPPDHVLDGSTHHPTVLGMPRWASTSAAR